MTQHSSGQGRVRLGGRTYYCGLWGSPEASERYATLIRQWRDNNRQPLQPVPHAGQVRFTVASLLAEYRRWLDGNAKYRKGDRDTSYRFIVDAALADFESFAGSVPVHNLSEALMTQFRYRLEQAYPKTVRGYVTRKLRLVLRMLRWGKPLGFVPQAVLASCKSVELLAKGECGDRPEHGRERRAVSPADVAKVATRCRPAIRALMELQLATAMRPGEACAIRWVDIDKAGPSGTWVYVVTAGKTEHHGRAIRYFLGAAAKAVLEQQPTALPTAPIFAISTGAYRAAVLRACRQTGVPLFCPHELRHSALTAIAEKAGVAAASAAAGHASIATTARYLHRNDQQALLAVAVLDARASG